MNKAKKIIRKLKEGFLQQAFAELFWIFKLLVDYRWKIISCAVVMLISTLISLWLTMKMGTLVDGLVSQDWKSVITVAIFYVVIGSINVCLSMISQRLSGWVNAQVKTELSNKTYQKILYADWETVTQLHSGDLMTRLQEDIGSIASSTVGWIPTLCAEIVKIGVALCVIICYDFSMLLIVMLVAPIIFMGSRILLGKMYESNRQQRKISSDVMSLYKESFQHLQTIKSFGLLCFFNERMREKQQQRQENDLQVNKYSIASWSVMYVSGQIAALICLAWILFHVYQGILSMGMMTVLFIYANTIAGSFKSFIQLIPTAVGMISSTERLRVILELPEELLKNEEQYRQMYYESLQSGASVEINHLNFQYQNGTVVFEDVKCMVGQGEIVALVGPSGEGKTTMLRILLGIVKTNGSCKLRTEHFCLPVAPEGRSMMAYVPQGNTMMNGTIAENMRMLKPDATEEEIILALKDACAYEFVEKLPGGIHHMVGENGSGFSEGQNQRLAIARALMCRTPILLLDEATSALDVATERKVLANLMKVQNKRTCILTTHRPTVLSMCDRVYRIADKKVREIEETGIQKLKDDF